MKVVSYNSGKALRDAGYPQTYKHGDCWCYENGQYPDESEVDTPPINGYILLPTYGEVIVWLMDKQFKDRFDLAKPCENLF